MGSGPVPTGVTAGRITSRPLDWVMLDCEFRRSRDHDFTDANWAYGVTSSGDRVGVGLSAATPPETSLLLLDWCPDTSKEDDDGRQRFVGYGYEPNEWPSDAARAVAAYRGAILLRLVLPTTRGNRDEEFFVYQARPAAATTTLTRLPACGRHERVNYFDTNNMGILCRDGDGGRGGDFTVAHLTVTHKRDDTVTAELCRLRGRDGAWRAAPLPIRHGDDGRGDDLLWWETDAVVNLGDSTIGWVDYLRGILFCDDVLCPNPELQYVPLPVNPHEGYENDGVGGRRTLSPFRSVCVTTTTTNRNNGAPAIKFVDVAPWNVWFYGTPDYSRRIPAITSWTLSGDRRTWVEDGRIDVVDFFALAKRHNLPCVLPQYPVVDMKRPQTIYVALSEDGLYVDDKMFLVAVDMKSKTIGGYLYYACIYKSDEEGNIDIGVTYNLPFLPCEFSRYLGLVALDTMAPPSVSDSDDAVSERPCASTAAGNVIRFGSVSFDGGICSKEEQVCTAAGLRSKLIFGGSCRKKAEKKRPSIVQIGSMCVEIRDALFSAPLCQKPIMRFG